MPSKQKNWKKVFLVLVLSFLPVSYAAAQPYQSPNYQAEEVFFGSGGELDAASSNYQAHSAVGPVAVGFVSSTNYDSVFGFVTPNAPFLELSVNNASLDLGILSESSASSGAIQSGTCNCSFSVRTYLSSTYSVVTLSNPPTSEGGAIIDAKTTLGVPSTDPNVEEFGINLVDNSSPNVGANFSNQPDDSFADGDIASGYSTVNQFKYNVGDTIARSQKTAGNPAVGLTNYTISYIAKRSSITEAGLYTMRHDLMVIATY